MRPAPRPSPAPWPALALYGVAVAALWAASVRLGHGVFTYPLDDTYIHLAEAQHFARGQGWGLTAGEFASCSSSPLWTMLLSSWIAALGAPTAAPLVLATAFGGIAIVAAHRILRAHLEQPRARGAVLAAAILAAPLPTLALSGLEHALQSALALAFVFGCAAALARVAGGRARSRGALLVLALLLGAVRYESLLLVFCACVLFAWRREWGFAVALGVTALVPVTVYGLWSVAHGWYFLPNPILLKANLPAGRAGGDFPYERLMDAVLRAPHLVALILAAAVCAILSFRAGRRGSVGQMAALLFVPAALLHLLLARIGWLFRYEAYLVFTGIVVVAVAANEARERLWPAHPPRAWRWLVAAAVFVLLAPLAIRAGWALTRTPRATENIHDQQLQMGRFVARYYRGAGVAANDVGALTYLGQPRLLDLFGLADLEVARRKLAGSYGTADIREVARGRGVKVAVVYDEWFERLGGVPPEWVKAGEWTIAHNVVCGSDRVSWYAVDPGEAPRLIESLRAFAPELPADVAQSGRYAE